MDFKFWLEIVIIIILVFISGFFSASEIAVIAVRKSRIKKLSESPTFCVLSPPLSKS